MKCQKCYKYFCEEEIDEHHIHPRFMDNRGGGGKKAYLCKKCHQIIHLVIPKLLWDLMDQKQKEKAIEVVKRYTRGFL